MMEYQIFQLIGLYSVYYILMPGLIFLMILKIKEKAGFIKTMMILKQNRKRRTSDILKENKKALRNLQVLFVVLLLVSMPVLNLTFYGLQDISMHRSRNYLSGETVFPAHFDLVDEKLGPGFDTEDVIQQMEEKRDIERYMEDIQYYVSLDELTQLPGWLTVYLMRETSSTYQRIVINYAYLSPVPITRSIEFVIVEKEAFLESDNLVVYPMSPSRAAPS